MASGADSQPGIGQACHLQPVLLQPAHLLQPVLLQPAHSFSFSLPCPASAGAPPLPAPNVTQKEEQACAHAAYLHTLLQLGPGPTCTLHYSWALALPARSAVAACWGGMTVMVHPALRLCDGACLCGVACRTHAARQEGPIRQEGRAGPAGLFEGRGRCHGKQGRSQGKQCSWAGPGRAGHPVTRQAVTQGFRAVGDSGFPCITSGFPCSWCLCSVASGFPLGWVVLSAAQLPPFNTLNGALCPMPRPSGPLTSLSTPSRA